MENESKAVFIKKISCPSPEHEDSNPSCALYSDGSAYCFACNMYFKDVEAPIAVTAIQKKEIEDLDVKLTYIASLPTERIRGLEFHYDNSGYYVVWPNSAYYKLRAWAAIVDGSRYLSPLGHTKPLFVIEHLTRTKTLVIVEGEINALSLAKANPPCDIVSPGGVGSFTDKTIVSSLPLFGYYDNIIICVDSDAPGLKGALGLKKLLYDNGISADIVINLMETDFNQLLVEHGENFKDIVKKEFKELGMSEGMQFD